MVICFRYEIEKHNSLRTIINLSVFVISRRLDRRDSSPGNDNFTGAAFGPIVGSCFDDELCFLGNCSVGIFFRKRDITAFFGKS